MQTAYIETTIPSYLTAKPSRDLIIAANQQITHDWWVSASQRFGLRVSETVLAEIRGGDPAMSAKRLRIVEGIPVLKMTQEVREIGRIYERLGLSGRGRADIPHFAFAVAYRIDYLVTWNCAHIANGEIIRRLFQINQELNRFCPIIVTPQELMDRQSGG